MNQLSFLTAEQISEAARKKKISPVEVVDYFIRRIESRNPSINALVFIDEEQARRRAAELEASIMAGESLGSFCAVPTACKDFIPGFPGWPGTFGGIKAVSQMLDQSWGNYASSMQNAGAIFMGKTNSPSLAFRGTCDNYMFGPTRNPFNTAYNSGGSSGGSAAAVADGLMPIAEGTDGGGSIRIPAAWCGLYGFKAALGTISGAPRPNAFTTSHPYCINGFMTRTVRDTAFALREMARYEPRDPFSLDWKGRDYLNALNGSVRGWRIGFTPDFGIFPVDPEIAGMVEKAALRFEEAGAHVEQVSFGIKRSQMELSEAWCSMISISGLETVESLKNHNIDLLGEHRDDLPPELISWIESSYKESYLDYNRNDVIRTEIFDALQTAFDTYDLIISPTNACHPVKNSDDGNTLGPKEINGEQVNPLIGWCLTYFANFTGHPAASIPAGLSDAGFPVGMQIIGKRFGDLDVLTASAAFESIQPWSYMYEITEKRALRQK